MRQLLAQYVMTWNPQWLCFIIGLTLNSYTLILIVCPRSVVTLRVLSCGSVLVLQFQKAPGNSKLISSRSILFFELLSLAEGGSKLSSLRIQPFLIHSFPAHWMLVQFRWTFPAAAVSAGHESVIGRSEKLRRIDWSQVSVPQDHPLSVLCFLPFLFIIFIYLFVYVFQFSFRAYTYSFTRGRTQICPLGEKIVENSYGQR